MNLFRRIFKFFQSEAHSALSKFEDPVKMLEQGIRDLKKDFDDSMQAVAQVKAIAIGAKKELETKKQIAADYEKKAMIILKKAQNNEIDSAEADRLASEALQKKQDTIAQITQLTADIKGYDESLKNLEKKVRNLKNQIQKWEDDYTSLKARAQVAKTTKKITKELTKIDSNSTAAMLEDMKTRIQAEENLAEAYNELAQISTIDEEIDTAIGNADVQASLLEMKQKLMIGTSQNEEVEVNSAEESKVESELDKMKKELDNQ